MMYEVETRVYFESMDEAFSMLPFLKKCLINKLSWETAMYGEELFKSGKLLRVSSLYFDNKRRVYWGYKEEDIGKVYNIRKELDENITDGLSDSHLLEILGGSHKTVSPDNVDDILKSFGHTKFMSFTGDNLTGKHNDLSLKLMHCTSLDHSLMLEIEKGASSVEEAQAKEQELKEIIHEYKLESRALKEEPTTMLYKKIPASGPMQTLL